MIARKYFCPESKLAWRDWLWQNALSEREIWLLFPHKNSGLPGITYFDALEEALCFGWIDGMVKRYDEQHVSSRFSPRTHNSSWSEVNKQHARLLISAGKMTDAGFAVLPDLDPEAYAHPPDIISILQEDVLVWENFCSFPLYYKNIRVSAIDKLRQHPDKFHHALQYFIKKTRANKRYGRFR